MRDRMRESLARGIQGAVLGAGAPLGWLALQWLGGGEPLADLQAHPGLYLYMLIGTAAVFAAFGSWVGRHEDHYHERAMHDELTSLFNRRYFWRRLHEEHDFALRHGTPLSLIEGDLDHFKNVNDTRGHAAGDRVLRAVAQALLDAKRSSDIVARIGGEELAVLLRDTSLEQAMNVAERMRQAVAALRVRVPSGEPVRITASFGVACMSARDPADAELLLMRADRAMYRAKTEGRDRVVAAPSTQEDAVAA